METEPSTSPVPDPAGQGDLTSISTALAAAGVGCLACDGDGRVTICNRVAARLLGADLTGRDLEPWLAKTEFQGEDGRPLARGALPFPRPLPRRTAKDSAPLAPADDFSPAGHGERLLVLRGSGDASETAADRAIVAWTVRAPGPAPAALAEPGSGPAWMTLIRPGHRARTVSTAARERLAGLDQRHRRHVSLLRTRIASAGDGGLGTVLVALADRLRRDLPSNGAAIVPLPDPAEPVAPLVEPSVGEARPDAPALEPSVSPPDARTRAAIEAIHARAGDWVRTRQRPLTVDEPMLDPFAAGGPTVWDGAWAAIPVPDADGPVGVLYVLRETPRPFDRDDLEFLEAVARQAGAAIARSRFTDRLRQQATELARHRDHLEELVADRTAELEATHARLRVADRLAAIGTFTAGLGHDMNNILFPLRCRLDALPDEDRPGPGPGADALEATAEAIGFLQELADGLRQFTRDPLAAVAAPRTAPAPWWRGVKALLRHALPDTVSLEATIAGDLPDVAVPGPGLTQATLNLLVNAATAMDGTGHITVTAGASEDGTEVWLDVTDDGPGMPENVASQIFDPFFTTGTRRRSTGLGLWIVHQVMERAGGRVTVDSVVGRGTTFRLWMPVASAGSSFGDAERTAGDGPPSPIRAAVTVADDRQRAWLIGELEDLGITLTAADDGDPPAHFTIGDDPSDDGRLQIATAHLDADADSGLDPGVGRASVSAGDLPAIRAAIAAAAAAPAPPTHSASASPSTTHPTREP